MFRKILSLTSGDTSQEHYGTWTDTLYTEKDTKPVIYINKDPRPQAYDLETRHFHGTEEERRHRREEKKKQEKDIEREKKMIKKHLKKEEKFREQEIKKIENNKRKEELLIAKNRNNENIHNSETSHIQFGRIKDTKGEEFTKRERVISYPVH